MAPADDTVVTVDAANFADFKGSTLAEKVDNAIVRSSLPRVSFTSAHPTDPLNL